MKRYAALLLSVAAGTISIALVQRDHIGMQPSVGAMLTAVADAQREVTRIPATIDRMTDA